jgi:hypothetical protein
MRLRGLLILNAGIIAVGVILMVLLGAPISYLAPIILGSAVIVGTLALLLITPGNNDDFR